MDVFTREQAITELSDLYDAGEIAEILAAADACGIFADEIAWNGSNWHVYVRAHQLSVNSAISYTITRN